MSRILKCLAMGAILVAAPSLSRLGLAQGPAMTAVRDTVYKSDGSLASGTVVITWRPFVTADNKPVFGGTKTVPLSNGALAVALVPNQGGTPSGTSYNVKYYQSGNVFSEETWVVPSSSALPSPGVPTVTNVGTPGSTTYYYWVSAKNANGETILGPSAVTTTSNSTLNETNYNQISWSTVTGATSYRVWRTTTTTAPSGTGNYLVDETTATSINDQSNSLQLATVPSLNDTDPRTLADVRVTAAPSSTVTLAASQINGTAIVSNPSATQTINAPPKAGVIPLQIKGALQDNSNVLEIYDSQSQPSLQSWFDSGGAFLTAKSNTGAGDLYGIRSNISSSNSSGARTLASAMESKATHNAAGTLTEMAGFLARTNVRSAGTVTNNYGLRVESQQRVSATPANNWDMYVGNPRSDFNATSQYYIDTAGSIFTMKKSSSDGGAKLVGLTAVAEDTTNDSQIVGIEAHAEIAHSSGNKGISLGSYADVRSSGGGNSDLIAGSAFWAEQAGTGTIADMASLWIIGNARYAGTVNNSYGILVSNMAGVGTNSWAIKTGTGKVQFGDDVVAPTINGIRYADQFAGADAGAKIAAAIADLPATGGTVDARGLEGTQGTPAATLTIGSTKPVVLLLGAATFPAPASGDTILISAGAKVSIIGAGQGKTVIQSAGSANAAISVAGASTDIEIAGLTVDGNSSGQFGIEVIGTSQRVKIENVECKGTAGAANTDCIKIGDGGGNIQQVKVLNSWVHDWDNEGAGISLRWVTDSEVAGNVLDGTGAGATGYSAVSVAGFQSKIHDNIIRGNFYTGISGFRGFENQYYDNQIIETGTSMTNGIFLDSDYASSVQGNTIRGAANAFSIEVSPYSKISGNTIIRNRSKGIYAWGRATVDEVEIDDAEDAWTCSTNVTCATTAGQVGVNAARMTIATDFTTGVVAYEDTAVTVDAGAYVYLRMWIRSDTELLDGVLSARLSATAGLATNTMTATLPKLHANTWQQVYLPMRVYWSTLDSIDSVGIIANSDPGAVVIDVDDVQVESKAWKYSVTGNMIAESACLACIDFDRIITDSDVSQNKLYDVGRFTSGATGAIGIFLRSVDGPTSTIQVFQNTIRSEYSGAGETGQVGIDDRGTNNYLAFNRIVGFPSTQDISSGSSTGEVILGNLSSDTDDDLDLAAGTVVNFGTATNLFRVADTVLGTTTYFEAGTAQESGAGRIRIGLGATGTAAIRFGSALDVNLYRSAADTLKTDDALSVAKAFWSTLTTVTFSATPTFDASLGNSFKITLTDNVTSSTLSNTQAGQQISFLICENGTGGYTFVWPANVKGGMAISSTANTCNAQTFLYDGTNAYALSSGVTGM